MTKLENQILELEKNFAGKFPELYKKFLIEEVEEKEAYEIINKRGETVYIYNCFDLEERNETYDIQSWEPDYFMIGQDGDVGYYINLKSGKENIFSLDLGAVGTTDMDEEAGNIHLLKSE